MTVAGRFDASKFACQNDLPGKLPNKGFDANYLVLPPSYMCVIGTQDC